MKRRIAYFSMEIALDPSLPTYAGGLGILAGDTLRAAADLELPMCAVTLLHRKGYFRQRLDESGWQFEEEDQWEVEKHLELMPEKVRLRLHDREVWVCCWCYEVKPEGRLSIPVYLLDTDVEENSEWDRRLTDYLYQGDHYLRICQEAVLGIGGVRMLHALGHREVLRFHMNEGHSAFLGVELLEKEMQRQEKKEIDASVLDMVRRRCVFTTHTPVPAGHDQFSFEEIRKVLGHHEKFLAWEELYRADKGDQPGFNMTYLALNLSHYVNGVAKKHGEISRLMFANYEIDSITNGVHAATWVCPSVAGVFDQKMPGWQKDPFLLRGAHNLDGDLLWRAHQTAKKNLFDVVEQETGVSMEPEILTLGFARRATSYKRPKLLFENKDWLAKIARQAGGLQLVFAGKAHPGDDLGKFLIQDITRMCDELAVLGIRLVYLENYDMRLASLMVAGVDVWTNTPQIPLEASGTSGMKAALNGVPSLSVLDGWWLEGCLENVTGWAVGGDQGEGQSLYEKLENEVVPRYCGRRTEFIDIMRHAIALNGAFFNTHRMMLQYLSRAYLHPAGAQAVMGNSGGEKGTPLETIKLS